MDGFRPDYLDRNITPNINYLGKKMWSLIVKKTEKIDRKASLLAGRQSDRQTDRQVDRHTSRQTSRQTDIPTVRQADGKVDRQTDRRTEGRGRTDDGRRDGEHT